jgi:putative oxidoreductase
VLLNAFDHYRDLGLLIARLGFGLGFTWLHGFPKLMSGMDGMADRGRELALSGITFGYEWWGLLAALIETFAGLAIAFGLFFRLASLGLLSVMFVPTVANFAGRGDPTHSFKNAWLFAGLILIGPGRYNVDAFLERKRQGRH